MNSLYMLFNKVFAFEMKIKFFSLTKQRYMIAALNERASETLPPADAAAVSETANFLDACNLTFEKGVLSHAFVCSANS